MDSRLKSTPFKYFTDIIYNETTVQHWSNTYFGYGLGEESEQSTATLLLSPEFLPLQEVKFAPIVNTFLDDAYS